MPLKNSVAFHFSLPLLLLFPWKKIAAGPRVNKASQRNLRASKPRRRRSPRPERRRSFPPPAFNGTWVHRLLHRIDGFTCIPPAVSMIYNIHRQSLDRFHLAISLLPSRGTPFAAGGFLIFFSHFIIRRSIHRVPYDYITQSTLRRKSRADAVSVCPSRTTGLIVVLAVWAGCSVTERKGYPVARLLQPAYRPAITFFVLRPFNDQQNSAFAGDSSSRLQCSLTLPLSLQQTAMTTAALQRWNGPVPRLPAIKRRLH